VPLSAIMSSIFASVWSGCQALHLTLNIVSMVRHKTLTERRVYMNARAFRVFLIQRVSWTTVPREFYNNIDVGLCHLRRVCLSLLISSRSGITLANGSFPICLPRNTLPPPKPPGKSEFRFLNDRTISRRSLRFMRYMHSPDLGTSGMTDGVITRLAED